MSVFMSHHSNPLVISLFIRKSQSMKPPQAGIRAPIIMRKRLSCNAERAFPACGKACIRHRNSLSRNAKRVNRHANDRKTVEQRSDNCKAICAKQPISSVSVSLLERRSDTSER